MEAALRDVRFARGTRTVLDVPGLRFAAGGTTALLGPNGSGKSTLLRLLAGLERPGSGAVTIGGRPAGRATRHDVAFAFQHAVFLAGSVRANLELGLRLRHVPAAGRRTRITEVAAACQVAHLLDRDALRLSGGESQRVNLARALCLRAPLTLLDEPLAGLDGPAREQLLMDLPGLLAAFATTAIVVTHDREEALLLGADLVVLLEGRVRAAGPRAEVFGHPPDPETAGFLGWTVLPGEAGGQLAVAPGALNAGAGEVPFALAIEHVIDAGPWIEAHGRIAGVPGSVRLAPGTAVAPGTELPVSAPASAVRRYSGTEASTQHAALST